jgi:hypothetical protein
MARAEPSDNVNVFRPKAAQYVSGYGPELTIEAEKLQALSALATDASSPGVGVTVSDLVNEALDAYLAERQKMLAKLAKADEKAEAERVMAVHGGEAA